VSQQCRSNTMKLLSLQMVGLAVLGLSTLAWFRPEQAGSPPAARGIPFGAWALPPHLLGPLYNGAVLSGHQPYQRLDEVRARKGQAVLYLARNRSRQHGVLSVAEATNFLNSWPDLTSYIRDGTVWGIIVSDDITGKNIWGPDAPYYAQIDSIAKAVKDRWPEARTIVRAPPTKMTYDWKWVGWAWAQYSNAPRNGKVADYLKRESAKADQLGLCVIYGLNIINGGDGSSGRGAKRKYLMTGDEFLRYYSVLLPHTPLAFHWQYRPELEENSDLIAAMQQVRAWADTMPRPSCRFERRG